MPRNENLLPLRNFMGINRADGAERANVLEFLTAQNFWQKDKGVWAPIYGASDDLLASDVPGCRRITAIHRHPAAPCLKSVLYHCIPDGTYLPQPGSGGLTLAEVVSASGTIFDSLSAAGSMKLWFCFSYVGMGVESSWDVMSRPGFTAYSGSPINPWDATVPQSITLVGATNLVTAQHSLAFPSGVRAVNVFMAQGTAGDLAANRRQFAYVGTLHSNSEVLTVNTSMGPRAAHLDLITDANFSASVTYDAAGKLPPGQYYISLAPVVEGGAYDETVDFSALNSKLSPSKVVSITSLGNAISVSHFEAGGKTTNGATHMYVLLGVKSKDAAPATVVGVIRIGNGTAGTPLLIKDLPYNVNFSAESGFLYVGPHQKSIQLKIRHAFFVKKDADRPVTVSEVFHSRSRWSSVPWAPDPTDSLESGYFLIRSNYDINADGSVMPVNPSVEDPSMVYFNGVSLFANGKDFIMSDGISACHVAAKTSCVIPVAPKRLGIIKNQAVCTTAEEKGVIFASNALDHTNWSDGGTGTAYKFLILGDPFQQRPSGFGVFSYTSGTEGPRTLLVSFQKTSIWTASNIPDSASGVNGVADEVSGRVGCIAWRTISQTKVGMLFLGSDGNVYMLRGAGEPFPIGRRVQPLLAHLPQNDTLMKMCSAAYHDNHWKLAYPSSSISTYCDAEIWADLRTEDGDAIKWVGPHSGREIGCQLVLAADGDDQRRLGALVNTAGSAQLDDPTQYQNRGSDMTFVLEWTLRRLNAEWNNKRWKGVFVEAYYDSTYAQSLLVEGFADDIYSQIPAQLCPGDVNGELGWRAHQLYFPSDNLTGARFKFKLTHTGRALSLSAISVPWKPERRAGP